jgi:hypothetical protein
VPRGSQIGERRGGRERGTPNRSTVLAGRMLAIASERSTASVAEFIAILGKDRHLPADIRLAVAGELRHAGPSRSTAARSSADKGRKAEGGWRDAPSRTAKSASFDILLSIVQDTTVDQVERRKAASAMAQHFLPKKSGPKRWWANAPADEYGFAVTPEIAAEYRDIRNELRRLSGPGTYSAAAARKAAKMRARLKAILHRLQCPCPSLYGKVQFKADSARLVEFARQRETKITLSQEADAAEAHCRIRFDCFCEGAESAARQRLSVLKDKERKFGNAVGPRLTWKEEADLRFLRILYPHDSPPSPRFAVDDPGYYPLRDELAAADGNFYPTNSTLAPLKDGEIEEFV